jgi:hypothetical protein
MNTAGTTASVCIDKDSSDNLHAVWTDAGTGSMDLNYKKGVVTKGSPWTWSWSGSTETTINSTYDWYFPYIRVDINNYKHIIAYSDGTTGHWWHSPPTESWTSVDVGSAAYNILHCALDSSANIYFVYAGQPTAVSARKATYSGGGNWSAVSVAEQVDASSSRYPQIRVLPDGKLLVYYFEGSSPSYTFKARLSGSAGDITSANWGTEREIATVVLTGVGSTIIPITSTQWRAYYILGTDHSTGDVWYRDTTDAGENWGTAVDYTNNTNTNVTCHSTYRPYIVGNNNTWDLVYAYGSSPYGAKYFQYVYIESAATAVFINYLKF